MFFFDGLDQLTNRSRKNQVSMHGMQRLRMDSSVI